MVSGVSTARRGDSVTGAHLLVETARRSGLARGLSDRLGLWRAPRAVHDPGKVVVDLAVAIAAGGDCAADIAMLRARPEVFGPVASDPTVSHLISLLAEDPEGARLAIAGARAAARARVWGHAGIGVAGRRNPRPPARHCHDFRVSHGRVPGGRCCGGLGTLLGMKRYAASYWPRAWRCGDHVTRVARTGVIRAVRVCLLRF